MSDSPAAKAGAKLAGVDFAGMNAGSQHGRNLSRRHFPFLLSAWLPVLVCVLAIAAESTAFFGADRTSGPLRRFFEFFHGPFTGPEWWRFHHYVRKCGHFLGYGILSIAWFRAFWKTSRTQMDWYRKLFNAHSLAMLGTFAVATCDEIHQTFLPNRTGSPWDVLLDCCGGLAMQLLILTWMRPRTVR